MEVVPDAELDTAAELGATELELPSVCMLVCGRDNTVNMDARYATNIE
jgi:hypothetical protein